MVQDTELTSLSLSGEITTCSQGINKLIQFYQEAKLFNDQKLFVDFSNLEWIDANLTALLNAIGYRLIKENKVELITDYDFLAKNFNVLFRNGWLKHEEFKFNDDNDTTLPCMHFNPDEKESFCHYIDNKLMVHHGMPNLPVSLIKRMKADLIEIFTNIYRHAKTSDPFFVCGQFYPRLNKLIFTMVDLGVGFLEPIKQYTGNQIQSDIDAIKWALAGNSTKVFLDDDVGGIGLQSIHDYCKISNGVFQIYSGTDFWDSSAEGAKKRVNPALEIDFKGSLLNLFFSTNR